MSQEQPQRPTTEQECQRPIKYGDVFNVEGELAEKVVAPRDAAMMQAAENALMGQIQKGGAASLMQSAARKNERAGFVRHDEFSDVARVRGISVTETDLAGRRTITESIAGQVIGQYNQRASMQGATTPLSTLQQGNKRGGGITIGEALEATVLTAGDKPVEWSDAAAIQAAEVRATGRTSIAPGGVAAAAQSAATLNAKVSKDEDKTKLCQVLKDAKSKLGGDKPVTRKDAEGISGAEMRNDPLLTTHPTGVAASVAAAARLNQQNSTFNNNK